MFVNGKNISWEYLYNAYMAIWQEMKNNNPGKDHLDIMPIGEFVEFFPHERLIHNSKLRLDFKDKWNEFVLTAIDTSNQKHIPTIVFGGVEMIINAFLALAVLIIVIYIVKCIIIRLNEKPMSDYV